MIKFKKIYYFAILFIFVVSLTSCGGKNSIKEYELTYELAFTETLSVQDLLEKCESTNNISLSGINFSVENSNSEVINYTNDSFELVNVGESIITLTAENTVIKVKTVVKPSLKVSAFETMKEGNSQSVSVKFNPATYKEDYTITSSDESVVSVNSGNKLRAEKTGVSTITVTTESGLTYTFDVTVNEVLYEITYQIDDEYKEYLVGDLPEEYSMSMLPVQLPVISRPG